MPGLPAPPSPHLFFASHEQRVALARRRFFEEGIRPSGMVSEDVIQSWVRCLRQSPDPSRPAVFEPVTRSRVHTALRANRDLIQAAEGELERLGLTLAGTTSTAMLTDARGVIIASTFHAARSHEQIMPVSTRIGVNLSEDAVGTTAPGLAVRSGQPSVVTGPEHFFGNIHTMHCAAAPIRGVDGQLAGVLDLSSEGVGFGYDAASVVSHYAAEIENRLLRAQSLDHLLVRLHITPSLLDSSLAGWLGVTGDGQIDWMNAAAARLLGLPVPMGAKPGVAVEPCLGLPLAGLMALTRQDAPQPLALPSGLRVWLQCSWPERRSAEGQRLHAVPEGPETVTGATLPSSADSAGTPDIAPTTTPSMSSATASAPAEPEPQPLREAEHAAILRALRDCGGNVSQAARRLGVSRGRIYRHLQRDGAEPPTGLACSG
jgi:sigma-54 dependent transcriptional regulator, acetoin dehydrogenase operon transcriptional activator AcoR